MNINYCVYIWQIFWIYVKREERVFAWTFIRHHWKITSFIIHTECNRNLNLYKMYLSTDWFKSATKRCAIIFREQYLLTQIFCRRFGRHDFSTFESRSWSCCKYNQVSVLILLLNFHLHVAGIMNFCKSKQNVEFLFRDLFIIIIVVL